MKLFGALGLNWKILLAQFINFGILIFILHKFGYKPMIKFLEDRKEKIAKGLKDAQSADEKLSEAEDKKKEMVLAAKKEGQKIIASSENLANKNQEEMIKKAELQAEQILKSVKEKAENEKKRIIEEAKGKISDLVMLGVEKVTEEKMDKEKDKELVDNAVRNLK